MPRDGEADEQRPAVSLPTGTVAFLFTDIEGSTLRWDQHRDAMRSAVERHDTILRREIEANHGYVFKTVGDAFCAAFSLAADAITAAIEAQRELVKEDFAAVGGLRVRMGVHLGQPVERGGDYYGPEVNRVARLMSIGHGGQVLVSSAVHEQIEPNLPEGASLVDLGLRRLKDLTLPEHVWQLTIAGLPSEFPPLDSLDARPNNLPVQVTALLGRENDLEDLKKLIGRHRLLTITGSGGVGKTRIALQVGADLLDRFADGVWFADLSPITDPELVSSVIANALGVGQVPGQRIDELIPQQLKRKRLLLIIDNCEHVLSSVAALVDAIHRQAPQVHILATSRQAITIAGEATYRLPSLAVPEADAALIPDTAMQYGSIALFVDRARLVDTRFALTEENAQAVAEICRRLDGIPLAIELAAARVRVLSIPNLAQRLNERFKILTGGSRTALPRQKTLAALIDWSYGLLTSEEQQLFARIGIFAGGFVLDAAVTVCADEGQDESDVLDLLASLTDKSLVVADTSGEAERYRLLESTRAYAVNKLTTMGERQRLDRRHAEYYRDLVQAADERYYTSSPIARIVGEGDLDNYRAALQWSITQGNDDMLGGAIAGALGYLWRFGGLTVEGRYWLALALERVGEAEEPRIAARLWRAQANLSSGKARVDAAAHAVQLYESIDDPHGAAWARSELAFGFYQVGRWDDAAATSAQALQTFREIGDKDGVADSLHGQARIARVHGDTVTARSLYTQAIVIYRELGDELGLSVLGNLAELEFQEGHPSEAVRLASEVLEIISRGRNARQLAVAHINLGAYRVAVGDDEGARASVRDGLRFAREVQDSFDVAVAVQHLALIAAVRGDGDRAARLLGYVDARYEALGQQREPTERWSYDKLMSALHDKLSTTEIERLAAEGAAWSEDQAVDEALKV